MNDKITELVKILLDENENEATRDDAAIDLGFYDLALDILLQLGTKDNLPEIVLDSIGCSIADIWNRNKKFSQKAFYKLNAITQYELKNNLKTYANEDNN